MSYRSRKEAHFHLEEEYPREVYCNECEKFTPLHILDCSFSHDFGIELKYVIVTACCDGDDWTTNGPCKFHYGQNQCLLDKDEEAQGDPNDNPCSGWDSCPGYKEKEPVCG